MLWCKMSLLVTTACSFRRVLPCWVSCVLSVGTLLPPPGICAFLVLCLPALLYKASVFCTYMNHGLICNAWDVWFDVMLMRGRPFLLCALPAWKGHAPRDGDWRWRWRWSFYRSPFRSSGGRLIGMMASAVACLASRTRGLGHLFTKAEAEKDLRA